MIEKSKLKEQSHSQPDKAQLRNQPVNIVESTGMTKWDALSSSAIVSAGSVVGEAEEAEVVHAAAGEVAVKQDEEHPQQGEELDVQTIRVCLLEPHA